jgi:hypothetical protein
MTWCGWMFGCFSLHSLSLDIYTYQYGCYYDTAKASAVRLYRPVLLGVNALYLCLHCYYYHSSHRDGGNNHKSTAATTSTSGWSGAFTALLLAVTFAGLQYFCYVGLVEGNAAPTAAARSSSGIMSSSTSSASLDLLAVTLLLQFGGLLVSPKLYYLLVGVPVWAAHSLYRMFVPSSSSK